MPAPKVKASFIPPMLLLRSETLPEGPDWSIELKLDGYRAVAWKTGGKVHLHSRNNNDFSGHYPAVVKALSAIPEDTVIDGEIVAMDESGRPSFNTLQNYGSTGGPVLYYVFDVMVLAGKNVMREPLDARRELLKKRVLAKMNDPIIRSSPELNADLATLIRSVKEQGFEGLVAKRRDCPYEPDQRSGAWRKMRINQGQEFVIGGYMPSSKNFDSLIFGYYDGDRLLYAGRSRNGFTPRSRAELFKQFQNRKTTECPFANLPESKGGRWGQGLTAAKMREARWLKPDLVAQFEFVEWTPDGHLRHSRFIALREDKNPREVRRES